MYVHVRGSFEEITVHVSERQYYNLHVLEGQFFGEVLLNLGERRARTLIL